MKQNILFKTKLFVGCLLIASYAMSNADDFSEKETSMHRSPSFLGAIQKAWNEAKRGDGVYQVRYRPNEVIKIRTRELMTTTVVLPPWERVEYSEVGTTEIVTTEQKRPNIMVIRPSGPIGTDTSVTFIGASGLVYPFYVRVDSFDSPKVSDVVVNVLAPVSLNPMPVAMNTTQGKSSFSDNEKKEDYLEPVVRLIL